VTEGASWSRSLLPWRASLGAVLVATADEELVLEGSAAAVWELLERPQREAELLSAAAQAFALDEHTARAALQALAEAGLCRST
jgi:hypothetical protein